MATLMARIKENGKFGQKAVVFNKRRPIEPEGVTSYFILSRNDGKRVQVGDSYKNIDEAAVALTNIETLEKSGRLIADFQANAPEPAPNAGTWTALKAEYVSEIRLEVKKGNLKPISETRYLRVLQHFSEYLESKNITAIADIDRKVVAAYQEFRIDNGAKKAFAFDTKILRSMFFFAMEHELATKNPFKYEAQAQAEVDPFSAEDIKKMKDAAEASEDRLMFWLLFQTGLRREDAANLRWSGINGYVTCVTEKRGKGVRIPIRPELRAALNAELANDKRGHELNDYVLWNAAVGKPFNGNRIYDHVKKLGERAGVENCHPHRFRHTFVVDGLMGGNSIEEMAAYIGDKPATVQKYYAQYTDARRELADKKFMGGGVGLLANVVRLTSLYFPLSQKETDSLWTESVGAGTQANVVNRFLGNQPL